MDNAKIDKFIRELSSIDLFDSHHVVQNVFIPFELPFFSFSQLNRFFVRFPFDMVIIAKKHIIRG